MADQRDIDGVLVQWGDRLFYPGNRKVKPTSEPRLAAIGSGRAARIRARIEATIVGRAPQVMVKVTGGGRGIGAALVGTAARELVSRAAVMIRLHVRSTNPDARRRLPSRGPAIAEGR